MALCSTPVNVWTALRRWGRQPVVHFLVAGGLLFAVTSPEDGPSPPAIVVTAGQVAALHDDFVRRTGLPPTPTDEAALIHQTVDEEVLYQEALARGLDRHDGSVRHRLVEKMRFLGSRPDDDADVLYREALELGLDRDDPIVRRMLVEKMRLLAAADDRPTEDEIASFFAAHRERYREPARVTLRHVFFATGRRGARLQADAAAVLAAIVGERAPAQRTIALGDPFPLGHRFAGVSEGDLARSFGGDFARAAMAVQPGRWSGPFASPYGLHLAWIEAADPPALPSLDLVRRRVIEDCRSERRERVVRAAVERLRRRYEVRIEGHV